MNDKEREYKREEFNKCVIHFTQQWNIKTRKCQLFRALNWWF